MREIGIDLSSHNKNISVDALKSTGATFAIIKTSEGDYYINDQFNALLTKVNQSGIKKIAYYHYLIADTYNAGVNEGASCLRKLDTLGIPKGSLIYADCEISKNTTESVKGFLITLKNGGYKVGFYTYKGMLGQFNLESIQLVAESTWLAAYPLSNGRPADVKPNFNYFPSAPKVDIWQYTDNLLGFNVDGNIAVTNITNLFSTVSHETPKHDTEISYVDDFGCLWIYEKGTFKTNRPINLRYGATTNSTIYTQLPAGSVIKYDAYHNDGTYVWLRQPRADGSYMYLVGRNAKTKEPWGVFSWNLAS